MYTNQLFCLFLLLYAIQDADGIFGKKHMNKLKEKAKDYYKSKFRKQGLNFLGYDLSEYPGANNKYRQENSNKWNEYYDCLNAQKQNLGARRHFTPEARQAFEGGSVKFECKICISPKERYKIDAVEWDWSKINGNYLAPVEFTEHIYVSPEDKTLHIYNLQDDNSGQYVCRIGQTMTAPYFLTVIKVSDNMTEVHPRTAAKGPYPKPTSFLNPSTNLKVDTVWGEWSPCSRCKKVGIRHKFGYCVVYFSKLPKHEIPIIHDEINLPKNYTDLIEVFRDGIPCLSHILPRVIKEIPEIQRRGGEIMTGFCKTICPKPKIFEVKDTSGKVLETANNSAGEYSMLQAIPPAEPPVVRTVQYYSNGDDIKLSCPGNLNNDALIRWQIGSKNVIPEVIAKDSGGRVSITLTNKMHIKEAKIADTNIYSCWQEKELAGVVRLVVEKKLKMNINHHVMLFGIVIILLTFLYVFTKAFFGRKYATEK